MEKQNKIPPVSVNLEYTDELHSYYNSLIIISLFLTFCSKNGACIE